MRKTCLLVVIGVLLSITISIQAQDDTCPGIIENALMTTGNLCVDTGRNQACYGNTLLEAEPQPDAVDFVFQQIADITEVAAIKTLQLSPMDVEQGVWGMVLMQVQANLPGTLPGQNVTMLLFGDTTVTNMAETISAQIPPTLLVINRGQANANVRVGPYENATVSATIAPGMTVTANGRNADSTWLRIQYGEDKMQLGWVFEALLQVEGDLDTLNVITPSQPDYGPMQAFYLTTGIGQSACAEAPSDGLLVQTPQGAGTINLLVNQVEIELGSTAFLHTAPITNIGGEEEINLVINLIEGKGRAAAQGITLPLLAGSHALIPLDENLHPTGPPTLAAGYFVGLEALPLSLLPQSIAIAADLDADTVTLLTQYWELLAGVPLEDAPALLAFLQANPNPDASTLLTLLNDLGITYYNADLANFLATELEVNLGDWAGSGMDANVPDSGEGLALNGGDLPDLPDGSAIPDLPGESLPDLPGSDDLPDLPDEDDIPDPPKNGGGGGGGGGGGFPDF